MPKKQLLRVVRLLLQGERFDPSGWWWLGEAPRGQVDKKGANKFFLACLLDYQMRAEVAWESSRRLAEDILGDPDDLWEAITAVPESEWEARFREYRLHRFPQAHERVWRIGQEVVSRYGGDARNIWNGQTPAEVMARLEAMRVGPQTSRMIVGALIDTGHIRGRADVKADIHVTRVLGRLLLGRPLTEEEATTYARAMHPENPWLLDGPLYTLGKETCFANNPQCERCYMREVCTFVQHEHRAPFPS